RMNRLVTEYPKSRELGLRHVDALVLRPSQDLGVIATEFENELPRALRHIIRGLGSRDTNRSDVIATLLFQPLYIRKMLEILDRDTVRDHQGRQLHRFLRDCVLPFSAHYRCVFAEQGLTAHDIPSLDDLRKIPFTSKQDLLPTPEEPRRSLNFALIPDAKVLS